MMRPKWCLARGVLGKPPTRDRTKPSLSICRPTDITLWGTVSPPPTCAPWRASAKSSWRQERPRTTESFSTTSATTSRRTDMALVRRYVQAEQWTPTGIAKTEPNALAVVHSRNNRSVIAGPGSGKTELLAQRASYLLQCGVCVMPRRILAISYKRDAARNIAQRVSARCHPEQAHRFDSPTFDAFAKSLLDRFGQALPQARRPTP